ncbi:MAG: hypothetical protein QNJ22_19000 [Desulfosarcinaceae bacterium]|nr:hypothetical protein [Desulfosarcinaceae bacterium]
MKRNRMLVGIRYLLVAVLVMWASAGGSPADAFVINVTDMNGGAIGNFRYTIEEDVTFHPVPGDTSIPAQAKDFHRSYMPVVMTGDSAVPADAAALAAWTPDPGTYYFVSVIPNNAGGYALGGGPVRPGDTEVNITLNSLPIPTAQISIYVFQDTDPINNAPDLPQEQGLAGFIVNLSEAGGRFGASGGPVTQDAFGNLVVNAALPPAQQTPGVLVTNADGVVLVKNLPPAKYGITVSPPLGSSWRQTSTIEGSPTIDAWVKANEPQYFTEFGPAGHHANFGFVMEMDGTQDRIAPAGDDLPGGFTISGKVFSTHLSRPPDYTFHRGYPFPDVWVGLNNAAGQGLFAMPASTDPNTGETTFSIPNVPPGNYTVVFWDSPLDLVFGSQAVSVVDQNVDMGDVGVFNWFTHLRGKVFFDTNMNGFPDPGELGQPSFVTIRFRDGSVYDGGETEANGDYAFDEIFPFFAWLVAEADFALPQRATGVTVVADAGGEVLPHEDWDNPSFGRLNPQAQPENGGLPYRTEAGEVITQGFQGFLGQTNVIYWGKNVYDRDLGENGGVSGVVSYDITRAEANPVDNVAEEWQPGVPRVPMVLYEYDPDTEDIKDQDTPANGIQLADVDHYPFNWYCLGETPCPGVMGPEDIDRNGTVGTFDLGDAIEVAATDSWDDSKPTGCPGGDVSDGVTPPDKCYDGLRMFNQVRNAIYDGGYAFPGYQVDPDGLGDNGGLMPGRYVAEAIPPNGYKIGQAQHKNVDFGEEYVPAAFPPDCIGDEYPVPQFLDLFPNQVVHPFYDPDSNEFIQEWSAGPVMLPNCDRKLVTVSATQNTPADFFLMTDAPVAGHMRGFILDDLANEFDPNNPNFGEKFGPPWVPVGVYDFAGNQITRFYSDQYGNYNGLVPSTFTTNIPSPSGMSPNMLIACMNDPGPIEVSPGVFDIDPAFKRQYSQFCYTFQYMPGTTTYLDTPVLAIAAFASKGDRPLDCELPNLTPMIHSVSVPGNGVGGGPYIEFNGAASQTMQITSVGTMAVGNPAYTAGGTEPLTIDRDYGFGGSGLLSMVNESGVSADFTVTTWVTDMIEVSVANTTPPGTYQLNVTRTFGGLDPITSPLGVSVTVGPLPPTNQVWPVAAGGSIQSAIDAAAAGDLILVAPGAYDELVVMYKAVKLQGWGAPSVTINAVKRPGEKIQAWRDKVTNIVNTDPTYLLPGQTVGFDPQNNEPDLLSRSEGAGIMVLGNDPAVGDGGFLLSNPARIDGISITGADLGGAIVVNGYAHGLEIGNNRLFANEGHLGGGIQVGQPFIDAQPIDAGNDGLYIHHNWISGNGSPIGYPGGIALYTGAHDYLIAENYICGNLGTGSGGGIGHMGFSNNGRIADNTILFNQSFTQSPLDIGGGGIAIEGAQVVDNITPGAGNVTIIGNLIQGNNAGAGDGGGIRLAFVNGEDVGGSANIDDWYFVNLFNNMVVNNVTGKSGAGISLQDAVRVRIIGNTVANNDSTATVGALITTVGTTTSSDPQPGVGIVANAHSAALAALLPAGQPDFSDPTRLANNIVTGNRAFSYDLDLGLILGGIDDLAVVGTAGAETLDPRYSLLTDATGFHASNLSGDAVFLDGYLNGKSINNIIPEDSTPLTAAALDEGGNFVEVRYDPVTPVGDYHTDPTSPAVNNGQPFTTVADLTIDIDGDARVHALPDEAFDIGADEVAGATGGRTHCFGDLNFDQAVDFIDFTLFTGEFGSTGCNDLDSEGCAADLNNDGIVDFIDFTLFTGSFGSPCN